MRNVLLIFALLLTSCAGVAKEELNNIHRIGILSEVGNKADIVFVGTTVFTNGVATTSLDDWDTDTTVTQYAAQVLQKKYSVYDLSEYRGKLSNKYNSKPSFGDGWFDYENLAQELAKIGKANNLDAVIYISPRSGDFGAISPHVVQTKDTFGLEGTIIASNLYGFLVGVEKQKILYSLDSYNLNVGTFSITGEGQV